MESLSPKNYKITEIRTKAEEFRKKYVQPVDLIPVPIEEIIEFDLGIRPWPIKGLLQKIDVDGFLTKDLKVMYVDYDRFYDNRYINRLRFTYAHEVGHIILHKEEIQSAEYTTIEEWLKFREEMSEDDLFKFEIQAYEFAGRFLVPVNKLLEVTKQYSKNIKMFKENNNSNELDYIIDGLSRVICSHFKVSEGVISRRLRKENSVLEYIKKI